jgi:hypothetical protein
VERLPIAIVVGADMLRRDLDPVREAARGLRLERLRTEVHDVAEFLRRAITSRPQRERRLLYAMAICAPEGFWFPLTVRIGGRLKEAMALLKKQEALSLELGSRSGLAYCYWSLGLVAREQHDRDTEREKLTAAFDIFTLFWANPLPGLPHYRDNAGYDAYLGLPLILILILQLRELRRRAYLKPLLLSLLAIVILSFGPVLHIANVPTRFWLPWSLVVPLPLISQALPNRFSMYVALAAGLTAALWLSAARSGRERAGRYTLAALACVCLLPNSAMIRHWTPLPLEPFFEAQNVAASLEKDANVIILPYFGPGLLWQLQSGMRFTQSDGYVGFTPRLESLNWPVVENLTSGAAGPHFKNDLSGFCVSHRVSAILVGPDTPAPLVAAISALRWPETNAYGVRVVRVPDPDSLHFHQVSGDYWPEDGWMGRQVNIVTHGQPMELRISGQYRPVKLGPVEIRATVNGSEVESYHIGQPDTQVLRVPANASVTLTASATFVPKRPKRLPRDAEQRRLSVVLSLQPEAGSGTGGGN